MLMQLLVLSFFLSVFKEVGAVLSHILTGREARDMAPKLR